MGGRRTNIAVGARISIAEKARIDAAARAVGMSTASYLKHCALAGGGAVALDDRTAEVSATRSAPPPVESYHVDILGPDTLRVDTGALSR